jgi:hypothetical protein
MALVIGQAAAMAASQMNRPYGPRDQPYAAMIFCVNGE